MDLAERLLLLLLLGWFLVRLVPSVEGEPYNALVAISETFTVLLVLIRKPGAIATSAYAWTIAIVGTCAALCVTPGGATLVEPWIGGLTMFAGLLISIAAKVFLNRSFGIVAANRGVKRAGPYRLVRHPMYLGYFICHIGFLSLSMSGWNVLAYGIGWAALILRMDAEEAFLSQDPAYRAYAASVRYRLFPGLY